MAESSIVNHGEPEGFPSPAWIGSAMALFREAEGFAAPTAEPVPAAFAERLAESGKLALSISKLRRQREQVGFVPVTLAEYLRGLASVAAVDLRPVLAWTKAPGIEQFEEEPSPAGIARLGRLLGIGFRQMLLHLRIGVLERVQGTPVTMLVASRAPEGYGRPLIDECETAIREVEQQYGPQELRRLQQMEKILQAAYESEKVAAG